MRTKIITIQFFILFLSSIFLSAQDDKNLKEKLNDIKGEVNKIVITTEKGDITFEGNEAEQLFKKMKSKNIGKKLKWISEDGEDFDFDGENVMIFKHGNADDLDIIKDGKTIKINVEDENGEKTVTVTTKENGEEKVETFKGKEAEEYLNKMEKENELLIDVDVDIDEDMDGNHVWIHKNNDKNKIEKDVKVEINNGVKKVTVKTKENGEEKVKVYEGDEAEKFLKEDQKDNDHVKVKTIIKDGKKHKKIIIKETDEDDKK